jgi:hypothetical protein
VVVDEGLSLVIGALLVAMLVAGLAAEVWDWLRGA